MCIIEGTPGDVCRQKNTFKSPVVYATDRAKALVPVLFSFCVALRFILRGVSCLVLPCSLSSCFVSPFIIVITSLGEEGASLCVSRAFVCLFCTRVFVFFFFPHPLGVMG